MQVDPEGGLADAFETRSLGYEPREVGEGVAAMSIDTEEALREYIRRQLRVPVVTRLGPLARSLDFVATAAPGVRELLVVGKVTWELREGGYDLIVVDAPATGHVVSQLAVPGAVNELVQIGRVRDQTQWMVDLLSDPLVTGAVVVTTPEEMPVVEALELFERLDRETQVALAAVVVNKVLPELFGRGEAELFDALASPSGREALGAGMSGTAMSGAGMSGTTLPGVLDPLFDGARLATSLRRSRAANMERLLGAIPSGVELALSPYLFLPSAGLRMVHGLADALAEELGTE